MRTLVADDNGEIRRALRLLLKELDGPDIVEAADMAGALEICAIRGPAAAPELVLLDWELPAGAVPRADPAAFVAALRQAAPGSFIIAMSARPEAEKESLQAGCDAFVSRTDPPDRLVSLILALPGPAEGPVAGGR